MSKTATIADKEREKRARVAELAHHELRLEGFVKPPGFKKLEQAYIEGALTTEQIIAELKKQYKKDV